MQQGVEVFAELGQFRRGCGGKIAFLSRAFCRLSAAGTQFSPGHTMQCGFRPQWKIAKEE